MTKRKNAVNSLPKEINEAYETEMIRIKRNGDGDYEIAKRALSWIYHAKRPLVMAELQEAITVDPIIDIENSDNDCADLDCDSFTDPQSIIDCCGSLILWERATDVVGFSHYTVSEFFDKRAVGNIEPELYVAQTCLTYLCFDVFGQGPCGNCDELSRRVQKYRLAGYVAKFCGIHIFASKEEQKIEDLVLSMLGSPARRQVLHELEKNKSLIERTPTRTSLYYMRMSYNADFWGRTPLHFLAAWGLSTICDKLLSGCGEELRVHLSQKWRDRDNNLVNTIAAGPEDLQVNAMDIDGVTPLYNATIFGHERMVSLLLAKGADVNEQGGEYGNALQAASWNGHREVVEMLLDKVDVNARG